MLNDLMTVKDISDWLMVDRQTVYRWVYDRKIPFISLGGDNGSRVRYRFSRAEIESWLARNSTRPEKACNVDGLMKNVG